MTPEEAQFATDNINIVWWYLDIPELRQHRFVNIACKAMQSAIGGEYAKRERRPVEVSMNSVVPGTDDLTFEDVLADANMVETAVFA